MQHSRRVNPYLHSNSSVLICSNAIYANNRLLHCTVISSIFTVHYYQSLSVLCDAVLCIQPSYDMLHLISGSLKWWSIDKYQIFDRRNDRLCLYFRDFVNNIVVLNVQSSKILTESETYFYIKGGLTTFDRDLTGSWPEFEQFWPIEFPKTKFVQAPKNEIASQWAEKQYPPIKSTGGVCPTRECLRPMF